MSKLNRRLFLVSGLAAGGAWRALTGRMENVARACHELRGPLTAARLGLQLGERVGELSPARMRAVYSLYLGFEWVRDVGARVRHRSFRAMIDPRLCVVHAEPRGLPPGAEFFYRFRADGFISPVGRTRTAPAPGTDPGTLTFAFASCQHFEEGWYHAHRFMAADDPDLILFLGDYMYEKPSGLATRVRWYVDFDETDTLSEYRQKYAQIHTDPNIQASVWNASRSFATSPFDAPSM